MVGCISHDHDVLFAFYLYIAHDASNDETGGL